MFKRSEIIVSFFALTGSLVSASEIVIDVPELVIISEPRLDDIVIDVPELVIIGEPKLKDIEIDVPELVIIGEPRIPDIVIDVDALTIIGERRLADIVISVPELVIIAEQNDELEKREGQVTITRENPNADQGDPALPTLPRPSDDDRTTRSAGYQWCGGSYISHVGRGVGTAVGFAMPFGQLNSTPATINMAGCTALNLEIQGMKIPLTRISGTRRYSGTVDFGDGPLRTLDLSCDLDMNLRGTLTTADANLKIERPVWIMGDSVGLTVSDDCSER